MESLVLVKSLATWSWFYLCIFQAYRRSASKKNFLALARTICYMCYNGKKNETWTQFHLFRRVCSYLLKWDEIE
jgi:hypothetical protein